MSAQSGGSVSGTQATAAVGTVRDDNHIDGCRVDGSRRQSPHAARNLLTNAIAITGRGSTSTGAAVSTAPETMVPLSALRAIGPAPRRWRSTIRACSSPPRSRSIWRRACAQRRGRGDRTRRCASSACRPPCTASSQGTAQAFQQSLDNQPFLIAAALARRLYRARHALRELRPSARPSFRRCPRPASAPCWR